MTIITFLFFFPMVGAGAEKGEGEMGAEIIHDVEASKIESNPYG